MREFTYFYAEGNSRMCDRRHVVCMEQRGLILSEGEFWLDGDFWGTTAAPPECCCGPEKPRVKAVSQCGTGLQAPRRRMLRGAANTPQWGLLFFFLFLRKISLYKPVQCGQREAVTQREVWTLNMDVNVLGFVNGDRFLPDEPETQTPPEC